jgi:hypothetical protein
MSCAFAYFLLSEGGGDFFINFIWMGKAEALLQTLFCAWDCEACECVYTFEFANLF